MKKFVAMMEKISTVIFPMIFSCSLLRFLEDNVVA